MSFILNQLQLKKPLNPNQRLTQQDLQDLTQTSIFSSILNDYLKHALSQSHFEMLDILIEKGLRGDEKNQQKTFDSEFMIGLIKSKNHERFQHIFSYLHSKKCALGNDLFIEIVYQDHIETLAMVWPHQTHQSHENAANVSSFRRGCPLTFRYCYEHCAEHKHPDNWFRGAICHGNHDILQSFFPKVEEREHIWGLALSMAANQTLMTEWLIKQMAFDEEKQQRALTFLEDRMQENDFTQLKSLLHQVVLNITTPTNIYPRKGLRL